jgi:hypothetical protein
VATLPAAFYTALRALNVTNPLSQTRFLPTLCSGIVAETPDPLSRRANLAML